jgi:hypothetical protein
LVRFLTPAEAGEPVVKATRIAQLNAQQSEIDMILGHKGDPLRRTTCEFLGHFADQEERLLPYFKDLFEAYCRSNNLLSNLLLFTADVTKRKNETNKLTVTIIQSPKDVYGNIRDLIEEVRSACVTCHWYYYYIY